MRWCGSGRLVRVDYNRSRFDQVLDSVPESVAIIRRMPDASVEIAEKVRLKPMR